MTTAEQREGEFAGVTNNFHPSDFTRASDVASAHALKLALNVHLG